MTASREENPQGTGPDVVREGMQDPVCIPLALLTDRQINLNDLRVLLALYAFADSSGTSQPTRDTLATVTGLPTSRISTITTRLATLGWLEKQSGSGKSATRYRLRSRSACRDEAHFPTTLPAGSERVQPAADTNPIPSPEPDLRRKIQKIVHEELTRLNGAGHLAGGEIAPNVKLRLKRFRKGEGG
ncbi:MAG: helix-turn-helix domain-containing protein [Magnetococcus sp. DMHC-1]|nr:helix-turn-helix domain-containing protein [Magnetococcales bacterium]